MSASWQINPRVPPFAEGIAALQGLPSSVIGDVMDRMNGSTGLMPVNRRSVSVCGNAVTVRVRAGDNLMIHKALTLLGPGDVLLVDGEGDCSRALVGEIMMTSARQRGALAFVIDAAVRDVDAFEAQGFPCWARGVNLRGPYKDGPGSINVDIQVGGMLVRPGDVIVGDGDGVIAVARSMALAVAGKARDKVAQEQASIAAILAGKDDVSWIDASLRQKGVLR